MRTIWRYTIPCDGKPHEYTLSYGPFHVALSQETMDEIDFWAEHSDEVNPFTLKLQVVGTGQPLPDSALWLGTTQRNRAGEVWHLVQLATPDGELGDLGYIGVVRFSGE
jgi:hypothetical protein